MEHGVLDRVKERMLPEMPKCTDNSSFNSASLVDVYTAFGVLVVGMVISLALCILERLWNKRTIVQEQIIRSIQVHRRDNHEKHSGQVDHQSPLRTGWSLRKPHSDLSDLTSISKLEINSKFRHSQSSRQRKKIRDDDIFNFNGTGDPSQTIPFKL